jgi:hypothetical protein
VPVNPQPRNKRSEEIAQDRSAQPRPLRNGGRGRFGYAATLAGFTRDFKLDQASVNRVATIDRRVDYPAPPELDGKVLSSGFSVAVNATHFENPLLRSRPAQGQLDRPEQAFTQSFLTNHFDVTPASEHGVDDAGVPLNAPPLAKDFIDFQEAEPLPIRPVT